MFASTKDAKLDKAKDGLLNESGSAIDEVISSAQNLGRDAKAAAGAVKDDLEGAARRTGRHVRELADSTGHSLVAAEHALTVRIRDNPIQSTFIALGIGLLAGRLIHR